mmetsp:Transcript_103712/g.293150  ORF Transcript_103712/g.293150 Transcript_103712/m.293150 type:complete len:412 (+) Transcript_103712:82-1317(+)
MADILEGGTEHAHYAPLSHAQTLAISRHLQEQIRAVEMQVADLSKGLADAMDAVGTLRGQASGAGSAMHALQDGLRQTNGQLDAQRKELARTNGSVQKLQQGMDQANSNIAGLRDAQSVANNNTQKLANDLGVTSALAGRLQEAIEKRIDGEIRALNDELAKTNLDLKHLRADGEAVKDVVHEEREKSRDLSAKVKSTIDKLGATDTRANILDQRLADNTANIKATRQNLEDLNVATLKLHEDHENTKGNLNDVRSSVKKCHSHTKQVHESLERLGAAHAAMARRLEDNDGHTDDSRKHVEDLRSKVQALREGQERAGAVLGTLRRELSEVSSTAEKVKAGLKEQSSLLLPNLSLDSSEARAATQRHGSLLQSQPLGFTPRKPPARPASRGGTAPRGTGSSVGGPNLMAWT